MTDQFRYEFQLKIDEEKGSSYLAKMVGAGRTVLEVGCATGSVTTLLKNDLACHVTGLEIDPQAAEKAKSICDEVIVGDIESIDLSAIFKNRKFDVITFGDVLEHLRTPIEALRKIKPLLSPNGYVVASIPNIAHASVAFELANGRFDYRHLGLLDETHIRFFTKRSMLAMFEDAGYIVTELQRAKCVPALTEFHTSAQDEADRTIINYFFNRNPEAQTYQFIVKAIPNEKTTGTTTSLSVQTRDRIETLERETDALSAEVLRLKSQLSWLDSRWPRSWIRKIASFLGIKSSK